MKPQTEKPMTLLEFILKVKLAGYASGGEGQERSFKDGSRGFEFTGNGYRYLDRYYGFNPFTGTEYVFGANGALLWVMNYYGYVLPICSDPMKIYSFLREAMRSISPEYPFRGPAVFEAGRLKYENQQNGTLDRFYGTEIIYENQEKVYVLHYHGGSITMPETNQ